MLNSILQQLNDLMGPFTGKEGSQRHQIVAYSDYHEADPKELVAILLECCYRYDQGGQWKHPKLPQVASDQGGAALQG